MSGHLNTGFVLVIWLRSATQTQKKCEQLSEKMCLLQFIDISQNSQDVLKSWFQSMC